MASDDDPVFLITGASTGIGFETAWKLAARGFTVYAGARRVEKMEPLKAHGVTVLALDVTDEDSMSAAVEQVMCDVGQLVTLYVNDFNAPARAAYRRVGFVERGRFMTVLL